MKKNLRFALRVLYEKLLDDLYRKYVASESAMIRFIPAEALVIAFRSLPPPAVDLKEQKTLPMFLKLPEKDSTQTGREESRGTEHALSMPSCSDLSVGDKVLWDPSKGDQSPVSEAKKISPRSFFFSLRQYFKKPSERDPLIPSDILNCSPPTGKGFSVVAVAPQKGIASVNGMDKKKYLVLQEYVDPTYEYNHEDDGDGDGHGDGDGDGDEDNPALMAVYDSLIAASESSIKELLLKDDGSKFEHYVLRAEAVVTVDTAGSHLRFPSCTSQTMTPNAAAAAAGNVVVVGGGSGGGGASDSCGVGGEIISAYNDDIKTFKVVTISQSDLHLLICTNTNDSMSLMTPTADTADTDTQSVPTALPTTVRTAPPSPSSSQSSSPPSIPSAAWLNLISFCLLFVRDEYSRI